MSNAARRSDRRVATVSGGRAGGRSGRDEDATAGCGSDTAHLPCLFLDDAKVAFASGSTSAPALGRDGGDAGASTRDEPSEAEKNGAVEAWGARGTRVERAPSVRPKGVGLARHARGVAERASRDAALGVHARDGMAVSCVA